MADVLGAEEEKRRRKIVVAVDESEESMYALKWCLNNIILRSPPNFQDALVIIHAKRPTFVDHGFDHSEYMFSHDALSSLDKRDTDVASWVLENAHKICMEHHVKEVGKMVEGDPRDVICEMVKVLKADLLVMGSHGYGRFVRALLGSVSNHCVQSASCPVLVVKTPKPDA